MCIYLNTYLFLYTYMYLHLYTFLHTHMHLYVCSMSVYTCTFGSRQQRMCVYYTCVYMYSVPAHMYFNAGFRVYIWYTYIHINIYIPRELVFPNPNCDAGVRGYMYVYKDMLFASRTWVCKSGVCGWLRRQHGRGWFDRELAYDICLYTHTFIYVTNLCFRIRMRVRWWSRSQHGRGYFNFHIDDSFIIRKISIAYRQTLHNTQAFATTVTWLIHLWHDTWNLQASDDLQMNPCHLWMSHVTHRWVDATYESVMSRVDWSCHV